MKYLMGQNLQWLASSRKLSDMQRSNMTHKGAKKLVNWKWSRMDKDVRISTKRH